MLKMVWALAIWRSGDPPIDVDHVGQETDQEDPDQRPCHVEQGVGDCGPDRFPRLADGGQHGGDGGADVGADHQGQIRRRGR